MSCPAGVSDPCPDVLTGTSSFLFLTLINTLFQSKCSLDTTPMYPKDYNCCAKTFDFIVVGAGSAGSVIANRLTENPNVTVLLIEAGGLPSANSEIPALALDRSGKNIDWGYSTISPGMCLGFQNGSCIWPRAKVLGGCSTINTMIYTRGRKLDYDTWEIAGNLGWNFEMATHYFKKSEGLQSDLFDQSFHGLNGPLTTSHYNFPRKIRTAIKDAATQSGYEVTIETPDLGYCEVLMNIENGRRCSNAKAFISKIKNRTNLYLSTNTLVEKLIINKRNKRADGVFVSNGKCGPNYNLYATKEVILSAGSTGSPEILLKSNIGPGKSIANLAVGENLQDHIINLGIMVTLNKTVVDPSSPFDLLDALYQYYLKSAGPLATLDLLNLIGYIDTTNSSNYPDIEILHTYYAQNDQLNLPVVLNAVGLGAEISAHYKSTNQLSETVILSPILLQPKSRGKITLLKKKVNIYPNYLSEEEDVQTMLRAIDYIKNFIKTPAMAAFDAQIVPVPLPAECGEFDTESYWRCVLKYYCGTVFHPIGTCKMGPSSDPTSVVSSDLKVHGVSKLRVVDASIMPTHITAHTNAPTTMIAEKAADIIKAEHGL